MATSSVGAGASVSAAAGVAASGSISDRLESAILSSKDVRAGVIRSTAQASAVTGDEPKYQITVGENETLRLDKVFMVRDDSDVKQLTDIIKQLASESVITLPSDGFELKPGQLIVPAANGTLEIVEPDISDRSEAAMNTFLLDSVQKAAGAKKVA